ncbi:flagellar basal body L-ring protein FlgH [Nitrosophilus kaiyonis]|uniref:flagellar basal body L-ring protein FlgH n=1 Tax=Nitrosophilus kaiyonis TaxID=2930200 RepID=UPI002490E637|nr:flagellar basal body L-ring protein FlgH [Nitrosophilus kaiyonis]
MQSCCSIYSRIYSLIFFVLIIFLTGGCSKKENPTPPTITPPDIKEQQSLNSPGSLYNGYDNLFSDDKAHNIGDIVTIKVYENISGQGSTNTKSARTNDMDLSLPSATIMDKKVPNKTSVFGLKQSSKNSFKGSGDTKRQAKLVATISARVIKVYPNGNLFIKGKKYIKINDDIQVLKISGIVKPLDISQDNSIDSSKISDMYVEYNGEGFAADTQSPGWLAKFLMKIWPF